MGALLLALNGAGILVCVMMLLVGLCIQPPHWCGLLGWDECGGYKILRNAGPIVAELTGVVV